MNAPLIETFHLGVRTNENRILFEDLNMCLGRERVALIGRNGVGKSTLLEILSGKIAPDHGNVVWHTQPHFVRQNLNPRDGEKTIQWFEQTSLAPEMLQEEFATAGLKQPEQLLQQRFFSHGEFRKLKMLVEKLTTPSLLILDEPTQDLDEHGISWLKSWLSQWQKGLVVASHDPRLLQDFKDFFIIAETGCRYFSGTFAALEQELEKEYKVSQRRYLSNLHRMVEREEHTDYIARRRGRKKRYGRVSELDRATSRLRLNQKRDYAQVKHGKMKKIRDGRIDAVRKWTKSTRRALHVELPLELSMPQLPPAVDRDLVILKGVSVKRDDRYLFRQININLQRERLAITGPNGVGKTTLLEIALGKQKPSSGFAEREISRIGSIAQGASDWMREESLLSCLNLQNSFDSPETLTKLLIAHKFPLALAQRPMYSLSPGERVRAALLCLFQRSPAVELLILDEPTYSLDLVGQKALTNALKIWPGGLMVASHNKTFLDTIGIKKFIDLLDFISIKNCCNKL